MQNWDARIEDSASHMDLLSTARDFLDSWEPEELALIPERARPPRIKGVDDLTYWHQRLVDCYCATPLRDEEIRKVREMLRFFAFALQRAYELDGEPPILERAAARLFSERSVPSLFTSAMTGASEH
ncbi:MAG TPA: hypothetical protein VFV90_05895 [Usitatibacter sp.]|jgi:hypothetical protein|nr:hypothetical protein [Usitatibacter sp.]